MSDINVKIDKGIANKILKITQKKNPLRKIEFFSEAVREALIEFIKKNRKYITKDLDLEDDSIKVKV